MKRSIESAGFGVILAIAFLIISTVFFPAIGSAQSAIRIV